MSESTYKCQGSRVYGEGTSYNCTNNVTAKELCQKLNQLTTTKNTTKQLDQIQKQTIQITMTLKILETEINNLTKILQK